MTKQKSRYLSYLLRLWQTGDKADAVWRASLESPMTGERQGFASLKDLCAYLEAQASGAASQDMDSSIVRLYAEGGKGV